MSSLNVLARELSAKIVFYGPGLSGKTTSLKKIYESVRPAHRGELMSLATEGDRTLFFDFLPVKVERVGDCAVRLALYTVPGQVFYNATRKLVLQGADGVVFVADSQEAAMDQNRESLANLEENLLEQGIRLEKFPVVIQWNKRDLEHALPVEELRRELNPRGVPDFETSAASGRGILDTLKAVTRMVIKDLKQKRVVPPPRKAELPKAFAAETAAIQGQIEQQLARAAPQFSSPPALTPRAPQALGRPALEAHHPQPLGMAAALAPGELLDSARAADTAFHAGNYLDCVRACQDSVRRALLFAGEGGMAAQGFLLRMDGGDLLRLSHLATRGEARVDDAAFAVYVLMQALTRLASAGLPAREG